jgi:Ni,Fe-hydrogenase III large subunit
LLTLLISACPITENPNISYSTTFRSTSVSRYAGDRCWSTVLRNAERSADPRLGLVGQREPRSDPSANCALAEHVSPLPAAGGPRSGIGIIEGWRGTIVHRVEINAAAMITRSKIVDPSWFNWPALPVAMADTIVPDFPLANKSFNLSYAGNDL